MSPEKTREIRAAVAKHLGKLIRGFDSGDLNEGCIENIDDTHFVIDLETGRTLGFVGETSIKYAEVVSGGEGMKMVVRLSEGLSARVRPLMMIFTNASVASNSRGSGQHWWRLLSERTKMINGTARFPALFD